MLNQQQYQMCLFFWPHKLKKKKKKKKVVSQQYITELFKCRNNSSEILATEKPHFFRRLSSAIPIKKMSGHYHLHLISNLTTSLIKILGDPQILNLHLVSFNKSYIFLHQNFIRKSWVLGLATKQFQVPFLHNYFRKKKKHLSSLFRIIKEPFMTSKCFILHSALKNNLFLY